LRKRHFSKFRQLDREQRAVLLEAVWTLAAAQAAVRLLPFRWFIPRLGSQMDAPPEKSFSAEQVLHAQHIGWAVQTLARFLPWDAKCLAQAVAGKWMLQRRDLPSTLYLGVDRGQKEWLEAHAWLRFGSEILTGEPQHERFTVIATFTEDWS
jgi:hypothetical protein